MRGTLHLVTPKDIHWMLELLAPRIIRSNKRRCKELKLDETILKQSNQILKDVFNKGKLDRKELLTILQENGISTEGQRAAYLLQRASLDGLICQCGMHRNNPLYISMDSLPHTETIEGEEALGELARRYFKSHGPATLNDFIWWSGLLAADARAGLDAIQSDLIFDTISGQKYWYFKEEHLIGDISPVAHLLPTYDEYLYGYKDRSAPINSDIEKELKNRYTPTIAINGLIIGTWKRTFKKDTVIIVQQLFKNLNKNENKVLNQMKLFMPNFWI